jgi:type I restriction enzyme M protein
MNQELGQKLRLIIQAVKAGGVRFPVSQIEQLSCLIYLKILDEEENERTLIVGSLPGSANERTLFPGQAERFRWCKWRFKSGTELVNFVGEQVFPYMSSLVHEAPQVADYFKDAVLEIKDPKALKGIVGEIDAIDFPRLGTDIKGEILEYLMTYIRNAGSRENHLGRFRTPPHIRTMMVKMVDPDFGDTIYDPACGTGGFFIDSVEHILAKHSDVPKEAHIYGEDWSNDRSETIGEGKVSNAGREIFRKSSGVKIPDWRTLGDSIYGGDVNRRLIRISMMNLILHGVRNAHIKHANAWGAGGLTEDDVRRRYKVILSNPPIGGFRPKEPVRTDLPTDSERWELLYLAVIMKALLPGGRCAVLVPQGVLFQNTRATIELRSKLVNECELLAVIWLPAGILRPYVGIRTAVLVFQKPASPNRKPKLNKVWFYDIRNDGYDHENFRRPEQPRKSDIPEMLSQWMKYKKTGYLNPPGEEGATLLPPGSEEPSFWWVDVGVLLKSDYDLSASGPVKPHIAERGLEEDPRTLINEGRGITRHQVELEHGNTRKVYWLQTPVKLGQRITLAEEGAEQWTVTQVCLTLTNYLPPHARIGTVTHIF